MKKISTFLLFAVLSLILTACNTSTTTTDHTKSTDEKSEKLTIYTTVYPLEFFAKEIGGDYVDVASIYPPGTNEHTFEPTQKDMMSLADADLFFYIGLGLEGFVENAQNSLDQEHVNLVSVADSIPEDKLHSSTEHEDGHDSHEEHDGHHHGDIDPHIWLSPILAKDIAEAIKNELVEALPNQEALFNDNYNLLISELDSLNSEFEELAKNATTKTFFVSHASFGYLARQYGLEQIAIAGINSQSEPSQKELTEIVELAKELDVKHILFEQNVSSKLATVIQNEVGAKTLTLHNLSVLTNEDLNNNETYLSLMQKNINTLATALNP